MTLQDPAAASIDAFTGASERYDGRIKSQNRIPLEMRTNLTTNITVGCKFSASRSGLLNVATWGHPYWGGITENEENKRLSGMREALSRVDKSLSKKATQQSTNLCIPKLEG